MRARHDGVSGKQSSHPELFGEFGGGGERTFVVVQEHRGVAAHFAAVALLGRERRVLDLVRASAAPIAPSTVPSAERGTDGRWGRSVQRRR